MTDLQSPVANLVLSFVARPATCACLTYIDRMDITQAQDRARQLGYDRMVVHHREEGDCLDMGNFLAVHRRGEAWSRWGFARKGPVVIAWCCLTGADIGTFANLAAAFDVVLPATGRAIPKATCGAASPAASVTELAPRLRSAQRRFGSAA